MVKLHILYLYIELMIILTYKNKNLLFLKDCNKCGTAGIKINTKAKQGEV